MHKKATILTEASTESIVATYKNYVQCVSIVNSQCKGKSDSLYSGLIHRINQFAFVNIFFFLGGEGGGEGEGIPI